MILLRPSLGCVTALALTLLGGGAAGADEGELRVSASGGGALMTVAAFEGEGQSPVVGGELSTAFGFQNWLDVGVALGYHFSDDVEIDGAALDGIGGDDRHKLFATMRMFDATAGARTYLEVGSFLRLRPLLGFRAGLRSTQYLEPELFFADGAAVAAGDSSWDFALLTAAEIGVTYRLTDSFEAALLGNVSLTDSQTSFGFALEFSWQRN